MHLEQLAISSVARNAAEGMSHPGLTGTKRNDVCSLRYVDLDIFVRRLDD
jgi:hypothetical protein